MKARKVKGLDPRMPLAANASRIVRVRLAELRSFVPGALDEANVTEQHDMRIAAKRTRYILEITESCFGPEAEEGRARAAELQSLLGDLHDCDVMLPRIREHTAQIGTGPEAVRGLEALADRVTARRTEQFERFTRTWAEHERDGVWDRLERAVEC